MQNNDAQAWDDYWAGTRRAGVIPEIGARDPSLRDFWLPFFTSCALADDGQTRVLDLGCGHGAVTALAESVARNNLRHFRITCLDVSEAAIDLVKAQHPDVAAVCASADDIPLPDAFFDHVVSQFGIEYAPPEAAGEAARVLRPGGSIAFLMHLKNGAIWEECRANRDALEGVHDSGVLPAFIRLIEEGLVLRQGRSSRDAFEQADRDLAPCVQAMEGVIQAHGKDIGGGLVFRTYADIAHMYRKMNAFEPAEVIAWADKVQAAMAAWRERMQSMLDAALDETALMAWRERLAAGGLLMDPPARLALEGPGRDGAWILRGKKVSR
jgi:ubiquinone/menaquinone biosynthesis C-methylase UbiE